MDQCLWVSLSWNYCIQLSENEALHACSAGDCPAGDSCGCVVSQDPTPLLSCLPAAVCPHYPLPGCVGLPPCSWGSVWGRRTVLHTPLARPQPCWCSYLGWVTTSADTCVRELGLGQHGLGVPSVRQAALEGPAVFPSYATWFQVSCLHSCPAPGLQHGHACCCG